MNKKLFIQLIILLAIGVILFTGCKKNEVILQFTLTVSVSTGVTGNPVTGTYTHDDGAPVSYAYVLEDRYEDLVVLLDGAYAPSSGSITMDRNHILDVKTESFDIRGDWDFVINWSDSSQDIRVYTFFGSEREGDVMSGANVIGEYTVDGYNVYFDTNSEIYEFTGQFTNIDHMEGTWSGSPWSDDWTATRKN